MWDPTISETAIATVQSLARGGSMAIKDRLMWTKTLRSRCDFMQQLYENSDFMLLCDDTIELLDRYPGREPLNNTQMTMLFEHLAKYGWALSPRMWTREEILLMCVILVDPALHFVDIRQKDKGRSGEAFQNRGMAALDDRVQEVMHARLSAYGFLESHSHLPSSVPAGVVLNSGGSYRQLSTWEYLKSARFETDPSAQHSVIQVRGAPDYVFCNAFYVTTTTKRPSGQPVYVSISPDEMYGPNDTVTSPSNWDSEPLVKPLVKGHPLVALLQKPKKKTKSADDSWATELRLRFLPLLTRIQRFVGRLLADRRLPPPRHTNPPPPQHHPPRSPPSRYTPPATFSHNPYITNNSTAIRVEDESVRYLMIDVSTLTRADPVDIDVTISGATLEGTPKPTCGPSKRSSQPHIRQTVSILPRYNLFFFIHCLVKSTPTSRFIYLCSKSSPLPRGGFTWNSLLSWRPQGNSKP